MSAGELILTFFIAVGIFGPKKLPMLVRHLQWLIRKINNYKYVAQQAWQTYVATQHLEEQRQSAKRADQHYQEPS